MKETQGKADPKVVNELLRENWRSFRHLPRVPLELPLRFS